MVTQPIFLISLPRSGSTLLQHMLAVSPQIASSAEPWLMLPLWGMRDPDVGRAIYSHHTAGVAINDFIDHIPDGERHFDDAVRDFALRLYAAAAQGRPYFLDKTPRYYLLIPYLQRIFPQAKFVLLVRHPLAVLASICETFNRGRFRWFDYWLDWIEGHHCMAEAIRRQSDHCRLVRYEDVASNPLATVGSLYEWLGVPFDEKALSSFKDKDLPGRMGDQTGFKQYAGVVPNSIDKWRSFFATPYRKSVAKHMIRRLSGEDLQILGYGAQELMGEISDIRNRHLLDPTGYLDTITNWLAYRFDFRYLQARYRAARRGDKYAYGFYRQR